MSNIFPDEKMIKGEAKKFSLAFGYAPYDDTHPAIGFINGVNWVISNIKSAASESLDEMLEDRKKNYPDFSLSIREKALAESLWQAAVISTAAKYEEKLREKDAEIERIRELNSKMISMDTCYSNTKTIVNDAMDEKEKLQAENEQLEAEALQLYVSLKEESKRTEYGWHAFELISSITPKVAELYITKINEGEK